MHLTLTPQMGLPGQPEMTIHAAGDTLTLDGVPYDLSPLAEGGTEGPAEGSPFAGPVRRIGGIIHATIVARLGSTAADTQQGPWIIPQAQGDIPIPAARKPAD